MNKNYEFLLKDISKLKNIGKKTATILKKKTLIAYLICYGGCPSHLQIEPMYQK